MYPSAYIDYLVHFHADRDWFECHEILEEYWKNHPDDPKNKTWVGLIQVAVSLYHHRRGNGRGALKMAAAALRNMKDADLTALGIDARSFRILVQDRVDKLTADERALFADLDIPLADPSLIELCESKSADIGYRWKQPSDMTDQYLLNKHTMRDRTGVIEARLQERARRDALRKSL